MAFADVIRIILGIINIIASVLGFIFGIILLAFGIAGLVLVNLIAGMLVNNLTYYNAGFSILIFIGLFFILLAAAAILGSCFAFCPGKKFARIMALLCLLVAIVGLIILFIIELAAVILAFGYSEFLSGNLSEVLSEGLNDSYAQFPNETQSLLGVFQTEFSCCGVTNGSDYANYTGFVKNFVCLPDGCSNSTDLCATLSNYTVTNGCGVLLTTKLVEYYNIVGGVGVFELILYLILIVISIIIIILISVKSKGYSEV